MIAIQTKIMAKAINAPNTLSRIALESDNKATDCPIKNKVSITKIKINVNLMLLRPNIISTKKAADKIKFKLLA